MKKRHYIQLAILLLVAFVYASLKTGTLQIKHTVVMEPTEGMMTVRVIDNISGETNETTTLSVDQHEIEVRRADYKTESDYKQAIAEAKAKLGFRKK